MDLEEHLGICLRACYTLIVFVTPEEERALEVVKSVCGKSERPCLSWDAADGFLTVAGDLTPPAARDPITALEQVEKADGRAVFVLKDFHEFWGRNAGPQVKRKLRNVAQKLKYTQKSMIVVAPTSDVPHELRDAAVIIDLPLPNVKELEAVLDRITKSPRVKVNLTPLGREKLIHAALGMTASQAQRVFARAIVRDGALDDEDIGLVTEEKKQIIRESEALEFYPVSETVDDVGGLDALKGWLRQREDAFTAEAREYGLRTPKGIALFGIPGTGKSLTAKAIGGLWRLPLLRLDAGALFGSLVGESEERTRRALRLAETVAPCILWVDEMEKAFAQGLGDSGVSQRVLGTFLTWMEEKTAPCFVVGTANDIMSLPPEFVRSGRFDAFYFLDLPTQPERAEIVAIHLRKRNRLPQDFDVESLAAAAQGYTGAEIEQAVVDAMYVGFNDKRREFTTEDIAAALKDIVPLSVSQRDRVEALRQWLRDGHAKSASFQETQQAEREFVQIEPRPLALDLDE